MTKSEPLNDEVVHIGQQIRELRKQRGLTLKLLAEQTGLSIPYLSQIENGHVDLNITNLKTIGQALEVPLITFFVNGTPSNVSMTRHSERRWYHLDHHAREALLVRSRSNLEIFSMRLLPGTEPTHDNIHPGEEFTFVVKGSIRLILNNQQIHDLQEGDLIYYLSDIPHRWQNLSNTEAEILVVNTPATY